MVIKMIPFKYCGETSIAKRFLQNESNDLIRDLDLLTGRATLLTSKLKVKIFKNCTFSDVRITPYSRRERRLLQFFSWYDSFVYCSGLENLSGVSVLTTVKEVSDNSFYVMTTSKL